MRRRKILKGLGGLLPLSIIHRLGADDSMPAGTCRLISQDILGPFALETPPRRADITGGQPGMPLELRLRIQSAFDCAPLPGARVSIWHSNSQGMYSGVNNVLLDAEGDPTGEIADYTAVDWLRGIQETDADGMAVFQTIVPGWYFPRPTHLHLQVFPPSYSEVATTQLYFPDEVCDEIYASEAYAGRGSNPVRTTPGADSPVDGTDEGDLWLRLERRSGGYVATHTVGVTYYGSEFGQLPPMYEQG